MVRGPDYRPKYAARICSLPSNSFGVPLQGDLAVFDDVAAIQDAEAVEGSRSSLGAAVSPRAMATILLWPPLAAQFRER